MHPPPPLPEAGQFRQLFAWLNQLRRYVISLAPMPSFRNKVTRTNAGVTIEGTQGGETTTSSSQPVWQ